MTNHRFRAANLERALMDRARSHAERDLERPQRPLALTIVGVVLAVAVVLVVGRGFDAFLTGFQRLLERIAAEEARSEAKKPVPVFAVPGEDKPAGPASAENASAVDDGAAPGAGALNGRDTAAAASDERGGATSDEAQAPAPGSTDDARD